MKSGAYRGLPKNPLVHADAALHSANRSAKLGRELAQATLRYDPAGNLASRTDFNGKTTTYS